MLLAIASGVIGVKMFKAVERKRFHSQIERLQSQLFVTQKLAIAMQADWKGVLKKEKNGWLYQTVCEEENTRKLSWVHLNSMDIFFNGKKIDEIIIDFFATGEVLPQGTFRFVAKDETMNWELPMLREK